MTLMKCAMAAFFMMDPNTGWRQEMGHWKNTNHGVAKQVNELLMMTMMMIMMMMMMLMIMLIMSPEQGGELQTSTQSTSGRHFTLT